MTLTRTRAILVGVPTAALVALLAASFATRGAMEQLGFLQGKDDPTASQLVDERPWQTASALAPMARSAEEQELAREAERLADHEVDQAFAMALRQAEMASHALSGPALALQQRANDLAEVVKGDQARVDGLTAQMAAASKNGAPAPQPVSDSLDEAKAQLQLDIDQKNDATEDLNRATGDRRGRIQQELAAHEAAMQKYDSQASGGEMAVSSVKRYGTLAARTAGWFEQRSRRALLIQAQQETDADVAQLSTEHAVLEKKSSAMLSAVGDGSSAVAAEAEPSGSAGSVGGTRMERMAKAHTMAQTHTILDDRLETEQQLSAVYERWTAQVDLQHRILMHLIFQSLAGIAGLVLVAVLLWWVVDGLLVRSSIDRRTLHTLRTTVRLGTQLFAVGLVLVAIFGLPDHTPTILGLATAGLTVVFQDFILAFFGWFVLMGRNGIRVGDWVEINGVGGEVVEVGVFRTALLETGNWTDKGHPTGRRVTFINNFAISGQFFNFSTAGQWMWDEISMNVPAGEGSYRTIEAIHKAVLAQTEADAKLAEQEWKSATRQQGLGQFSAVPSVDMRPAASGIDILVRYVTRAGERFEMRNKLYQTVLGLLHQPEAEK
jgi:small-conductance mechanosensitive channel